MTKDKALYRWLNNAVHNWEVPITDGAASDPVKTDAFIPAYPSTSVPDNAALPYLTYDAPDAAFDGGPVSMTLYLWFRTKFETVPNAAVRELSETLGYGGARIPCDNGVIWLLRGTPFSRPVPEPERYLKGRYVNITAQYLTTN